MMQDREYWLQVWRKMPDARYARERIKQIDRIIDRIEIARDEASNRSQILKNARAREFEKREVDRYTAMLADLRAERASLSRKEVEVKHRSPIFL